MGGKTTPTRPLTEQDRRCIDKWDDALALIAEAAPHARAMAGRLDRDYACCDEI